MDRRTNKHIFLCLCYGAAFPTKKNIHKCKVNERPLHRQQNRWLHSFTLIIPSSFFQESSTHPFFRVTLNLRNLENNVKNPFHSPSPFSNSLISPLTFFFLGCNKSFGFCFYSRVRICVSAHLYNSLCLHESVHPWFHACHITNYF